MNCRSGSVSETGTRSDPVIETWSTGRPQDSMDEAILVELAPLVRRHPWWQARTRLVVDLLDRLGVRPGARVLDAGCGWGVTFDALEARGDRVVGMDVARSALERLDRPGRRLIEADLTQPFPSGVGGFDVVLALDVIEHLDDDRAAIGRLAGLVVPGGFLIVSVPADPGLWSEFDAIQGHRRRYEFDTLRLAFDGSGLDVIRMFAWGRWLRSALRLQRSRRRSPPNTPAHEVYRSYLRLPPWPLPALFRALFALEHDRTLRGKTRSGTSLFAIARRDGTPNPHYTTSGP